MGVTRTDLFTERQNRLALAAKALAHPARIAIIDHLLISKSCINGDLVDELGLAQATISQHLKELKTIGVIKGDIEGAKMCYCINNEIWNAIKNEFNDLFDSFLPEIDECC